MKNALVKTLAIALHSSFNLTHDNQQLSVVHLGRAYLGPFVETRRVMTLSTRTILFKIGTVLPLAPT